jgi:hypothetical protein
MTRQARFGGIAQIIVTHDFIFHNGRPRAECELLLVHRLASLAKKQVQYAQRMMSRDLFLDYNREETF